MPPLSLFARSALATLIFALLEAPLASAVCNVIPAASDRHRGALGGVDRPFALPNDAVEVSLDPVCDAEVIGGFQNLPGGATREDDYLVTVLFTPPGGVRNAVVLAKSCATVSQGKRDACLAALGGASVTCIDSVGGQSPITLPPNQLTRLSFRFPDTDAQFGDASDARTLAGPATIAVTAASAPLPCGAGAPGARCAEFTQTGLYACVDELYAQDGSCRTRSNFVDPTFGSFTALPKSNDYQKMVEASATTEVRFAVDRAGNALLPFDWSRVQLISNGTPYPRQVRTTLIDVPVSAGSDVPLEVRAASAVSAWSPNGVRLPPIFTPLPDPTSAQTALFGTVDAPLGVTRLARRLPVLNRCYDPTATPGAPCRSAGDCPGGEQCLGLQEAEYRSCQGGAAAGLPCILAADCPDGACGETTCRGGSRDGKACLTDGVCPGGACGPALFDLAGFVAGRNGPGIVPAGAYAAEKLTPTTLEGQNETPDLLAFVRPERLAAADANGDGDATDPVVEIRSRTTGATQSIGFPGAQGTPVGRAVTRVLDLPFRRSALAVEDDIVAFFEPEALQATPAPNKNGDTDVSDHVLRVFRLGSATDLAASSPLTMGDPSPAIDGSSLAVSDGLVVFTTSERDQARHFYDFGARTATLEFAREFDAQGTARLASPRLSADGRIFVWAASADDRAYARDRCVAGGVRLFGCEASVEMVSVNDAGIAADAAVGYVTVSGSGRYVAFFSRARNLVTPNESSDTQDLFVRDRCVDDLGAVDGCVPSTVRVTNGAGLVPNLIALSYTGRFVLYDDTNLPNVPLWLHDRDADGDGLFDENGATTRENVSVNAEGISTPSLARINAIPSSDDGRYAIFAADDCTGQAPGCSGTQLFLRDRCVSFGLPVAGCRPSTTWASVPPAGVSIAGVAGGLAATPDLSRLLFAMSARIYLRDLRRGVSARVDLTADGSPVGQSDVGLGMDQTARRFVYGSQTAAVPGGSNSRQDVLLADASTGAVEVASRTQSGSASNGQANHSNLSRDGTSHLFGSSAMNLVDLDPAGHDALIRTIDLAPASGLGDLTGDGFLTSRVLRVLDTRNGTRSLLGTLRAASVSSGNVAFIGEDTAEVRLWRSRQAGPAVALGRVADEIALTPTHLAARVGGTVEVNPLDPGTAMSWTATGEPALPRTLQAVGSRVAYLVRESELAGGAGLDLTGDGDATDDVPRAFDAGSGPIPLATEEGDLLPARDVVLGDELVAFRVREADRCTFTEEAVTPDNCAFPPGCVSAASCDLDGDGTCCQDVLLAKDLVLGGPARTKQHRVVVCDLEACDPRQPYRVKGASIRFLEPEQGRDLNSNGLTNELLVRLWNVRTQSAAAVGVVTQPGASVDPLFSGAPDPLADGAGVTDVAAGEPAGTIVRSQGLCVGGNAGSCPINGCAAGLSCITGACRPVFGACSYCEPGSPGCTSASDCPAGSGATCSNVLVTTVVADSDGDGTPDPFDLCPLAPNAAQVDADGDGVGDDCDAATCGNGVREFDEECDDGAESGSGRCTSACTLTPQCLAGADSDGDGVSDLCDVCTLAANGPVAPDAGGNTQLDADADGYGNLCDGDLDQNTLTNFADLAILKNRFLTTDPVADLNGDGLVNFLDLNRFKTLFLKPRGPAAP